MNSSASSLRAEYFGWKPTDGVYGRQFIQPIVRDLIDSRRMRRIQLKRHVMEFNQGKLRLCEMDSRGNRSTRYPSVPVSDITYVQQEDGETDPLVFSLILLGFNEESKRSIHVHVWRGDSLESVAGFVGRLNLHLSSPDHMKQTRQKEWQLVRQGEARLSGFFDYRDSAGDDSHSQARPVSMLPVGMRGPVPSSASPLPPPPPPPPAPSAMLPHKHQDQQQQQPSQSALVTEELKQKLRDSSGAPLLHPARDYDTMSRSHGNVLLRQTEDLLRTDSKAPTGAYIRRSEIRDDPPSELQLHQTGRGYAANDSRGGDNGLDEPLPDYDSAEDDASSGGGASSGTMDSHRLEASFLSSSRSSISDHSADPVRGFSTWRRHRAQQQMRQPMWPDNPGQN